MRLSLRAIGLSKVLKEPKRLEDILLCTTDSQDIVENTIRELQNKKLLVLDEGRYMRIVQIAEPRSNEELFIEQEARIFDMFSRVRRYSVIAWFLSEEGILVHDDAKLRELVRDMEPFTLMLQWMNEESIQQAYRLLCDEEETPFYAGDESLTESVNRLQRLYDYAQRARGH